MNINGNVGFIQEVSCIPCQNNPIHQISYAVKWLTGNNYKHAWFNHNELKYHCNLLINIAKCMCHPSGRNSDYVESLMQNIVKREII